MSEDWFYPIRVVLGLACENTSSPSDVLISLEEPYHISVPYNKYKRAYPLSIYTCVLIFFASLDVPPAGLYMG